MSRASRLHVHTVVVCLHVYEPLQHCFKQDSDAWQFIEREREGERERAEVGARATAARISAQG